MHLHENTIKTACTEYSGFRARYSKRADKKLRHRSTGFFRSIVYHCDHQQAILYVHFWYVSTYTTKYIAKRVDARWLVFECTAVDSNGKHIWEKQCTDMNKPLMICYKAIASLGSWYQKMPHNQAKLPTFPSVQLPLPQPPPTLHLTVVCSDIVIFSYTLKYRFFSYFSTFCLELANILFPHTQRFWFEYRDNEGRVCKLLCAKMKSMSMIYYNVMEDLFDN